MLGWSVVILAIVAPVSVAAGAIATGLVLAAALATALRTPQAVQRVPRGIAFAVIAMVLAGALATALSPYQSRWDKWVDETWIKFLILAIPLLKLSGDRLRLALYSFLVVSSLVGVYAIVQHYTGVDIWRGGTTNLEGDRYLSGGFFGHHLTYGGHALVAWCVAVALLASRLDRGPKDRLLWASLGACAVLSLALLWSQARSAQLAAAFGGAYLVFTAPARARRWLLGGAVIVIVIGALTPTLVNRFKELTDLQTEETRLNLWQSSWHAFQARPWVGYGPGNFAAILQDFEVPGFYESRSHTHQDYIMHLMNAGLLGLAAALALLGATLLRLVRHARDWAIRAGAAALISLAAAGLFQVFQSDDEVEMSLYLVVGLALGLVDANRD